MTSRRNIRRRQCDGKQRMTKQYARAQAKRWWTPINRMNAYHCEICKTWHCGHLPSNVKRIIRQRRTG